MKRTILLVTIMIVAVIWLPPSILPQSVPDGTALWNEAWQLESKAKSKQELEQAKQKYEQALSIFEKADDSEKTWGVLTNLGKINCVLGDYAKGRAYYQKAVDLGKKIGSEEGQAQGLSGLGGVSFDLGQFDKAIEYYRQALEAYKKAGNSEWEALTLNHIGEVHREQGQYAKAMEYYQQALDMTRVVTGPLAQADILHNMGEALRLQGQYSQAMKHYLQSLDLYRTVNDRLHEGVALTNIGNIYFEWGRRDQAMDYYQQALTVLHTGGMLREEARTILSLGRIQQAQGERQEAEANFQKGLELYKQVGVETSLPTKLLADLYLDMGKPEEAEKLIKQANSPALTGRLHLFKKQFEDAQRQYAKLLESAEASGNVEDLFIAHTGLGKAYEALEEYQKAEEHYTKGWEMTEEIRSTLLPAERKDFFDVRINGFYRSEPAKGLTRVRMKLNQSAQSIAPSEATRARAFADKLTLRSGAQSSGLPQDVAARETELTSRIASLKKARNNNPKEQSLQRYDELTREINKAEAELKSFIERLRKEHPAYAAISYPRPLTLRQSALRPEEYVIMFDVSDQRVGVKLIKDKDIGPTYSPVYPIAELEADVNRFRGAFESGKLREFDTQLGKKLYTRLLAPILSEVPEGTPIIIIPHEILAVLPFEALVVSGKGSWKKGEKGDCPEGLTYLGDMYPISYYQSVTALTLVRNEKKRGRHGDKMLVLADPLFGGPDDDRLKEMVEEHRQQVLKSAPETVMAAQCNVGLQFDRLLQTRQLGDSLKDLFPGKADVFLGMDASKALFMQKPLKDYDFIVFATHGYYDADLPCINEPILAMTGAAQQGVDGLLRMSEITRLELNADLVALTACQTALGKQVSGEGTTNMGWAFQYAGAKSVLMTLWKVAEGSSVQLVGNFFRHLKAGKTKLEALTLARQEIRQAGYEHPYYWAPFILVGETQ